VVIEDDMSTDEPTPPRPTRRWHTALGSLASLVLLTFILVGVIPLFASYSSAWTRTTNLGTWSWVAIVAAATLNQISGIWPYQAAMPGLRFWHGFLQIETATAISNTVPAGGAVAIGMTYKMFSSFGFADVVISTAVVTTGMWNLAAKFVLPVGAIALLAITARPAAQFVGVALTGVVALVVLGVTAWLVLRSEAGARWVGRLGDRVVNWVGHFFQQAPADRVERSLLHFGRQTVHTMRSRGWLLTAATIANQVAGFLLVLIIVRAVGITAGQVTFAGVFTSFAVARLAGAIPITPGGLGTLDAAFISVMTTFGATSSQALTADLVWRLTTYFLPILSGMLTYIIWIQWRRRTAVAAAT
jgi:putative heme transporter